MLSVYKSTGPKRTQNTADDLKRPEMTSKKSSPIIETVRPNTTKKIELKGGSLNGNLTNDDTYFDEFRKTINSDHLK